MYGFVYFFYKWEDNNMIFLDTNAFYYASQISINNDIDSKKLRAFIKSNEMAISSVSFYEYNGIII